MLLAQVLGDDLVERDGRVGRHARLLGGGGGGGGQGEACHRVVLQLQHLLTLLQLRRADSRRQPTTGLSSRTAHSQLRAVLRSIYVSRRSRLAVPVACVISIQNGNHNKQNNNLHCGNGTVSNSTAL